MSFLTHRAKVAATFVAVATLVTLAIGASSVLADDPGQGQPGPVPFAPAHPLGGEKPKGGIGVLAAQNFAGSVNGANACFGETGTGFCEASYDPAEDLEVMDTDPVLRLLNGHPTTALSRFWQMNVDLNNSFTLSDETGSATTPFQIDNDAPTNSLHIDTSGNIGLGVSPAVAFHLARAGTVQMRLDDTAASTHTDLLLGNVGLFFRNQVGLNSATDPFKIFNGGPSDSLDITASGKVGVGTASPLTRLQVGPGSTGIATAGASLLVQEGVASAMIMKSTSGPEMFLYEDQNNGLMGTTSNTPFGLRTNNANRVWVTQTGNVGIGNAFTNPVHLFQVGDSNGAFTDGSSWVNASSRSLKANFQATDDQSVLQKLVSLPVDSWNYKTEGDGIRHLGPTAEDFRAAFGLGSTDKAISTVDADGVAMAAIKGLYDQVQTKDATIQRISDENTKLQQRLDALESRMNGIDGGAKPAAAASASTRDHDVANSTIVAAALALFAFGAVAGLGLSLARRRA